MRFLVDECAGPALAAHLRGQGHAVLSVFDELRGAMDDELLELACREERILVTADLDFGELIHRQGRPHRGVVLLRLSSQRAVERVAAMERLLATGQVLQERFIVVLDERIRMQAT